MSDVATPPAAAAPAAPAAPASTPAPTTSAAPPSPTTQTGTQGGATPGAAQSGTPAGATPGAPAAPAVEAYEIKLPDGVTADVGLLDGFKALAKESGLKSEAAQKMADLYVKAQQSAVEQANAAREQTVKQWVEAVAKDPELGGAQLEANKAIANKALEKFAPPELRKILEETGFINHPEMARFAFRIGKAMSEDSVAGSTAGPGTTPDTEALLRAAYPTHYQGK